MFISVDLPAPFSPSSACTSPRRRSKSMWSLARTPGNCFVIPRSSRTVGASAIARNRTGAGRRPPRNDALGSRRLDLVRLDRLVDRHVDLLDGARQHVRAEVALVGVDADAPDLVALGGVERA